MPGGDGTGPQGQGGRGGRGGNWAAGPDGECVCPSCGTRIQHQRGNPCTEQSCPNCSTRMVRK